MPNTDEDIMRGLMTHAMGDIFAPPAAAGAAIRRQRQRRLRGRMLGVAGTAAAAGLAAATVLATNGRSPAPSPGGTARAHGGTAHGGTVLPAQLTAAQQTLFGLSDAAAATRRPSGRYVALSEKTTSTSSGTSEAGQKTSVIDTLTGGGVTYQDITVTGDPGTPQPPAVLPVADGDFSTVAQLDAMPTDPGKLRAQLLAAARQQLAQLRQFLAGKPHAKPSAAQPTDDDLVFEQAANILWEPDLSPALRSALYKVLAATPGVKVKTGATDSAGRPAVEISRVDTAAQETVQTFENPKTGATLESAWVQASGGLDEDLYLSTTYTSSIPANPYQG